jgi:hypothetical protein
MSGVCKLFVHVNTEPQITSNNIYTVISLYAEASYECLYNILYLYLSI